MLLQNVKFIYSLQENRSKPNHQILLSTNTTCRHVEATRLLFFLQLLLCSMVLFEQVSLYNMKEKIPNEEYVRCLEEAKMVHPGSQLIILTCSRMRLHLRRLPHVAPLPLPKTSAPEPPVDGVSLTRHRFLLCIARISAAICHGALRATSASTAIPR